VRTDIAALQIKPADGEVKQGTALQLNLFAIRADGKTDLVPGNMAAWHSSNDRVAEVNRQGRVSARQPGTVEVTATYAGKTAQVALTVLAQEIPRH
jgi:hypothetical protein